MERKPFGSLIYFKLSSARGFVYVKNILCRVLVINYLFMQLKSNPLYRSNGTGLVGLLTCSQLSNFVIVVILTGCVIK